MSGRDARPDPSELLDRSGGDVDGIVQYRPGSGILHRLDPATKLVAVVGVAAVVFLLPDYRIVLAIAAGLLLVAALGGVFGPVAKVTVVVTAPLVAVVLPVQGLFYPANRTALATLSAVPVVGSLTVFREGVTFALLVLSRLLAVVVAMLTLVTTTHPKRLTDSLVRKGMSNKLAYVFVAALQFVPDMRRRSRTILDAQRARGLDTSAGLGRRVRALVELLSPLLIGTLVSTQTRALALESRGFTRSGERTVLFAPAASTLDRALRWGIALAVVAVAGWRLLA
jgi:energy-coupling factor transport system permease protein